MHRYTLQLGLLPLPKTANLAHIQNNADVDFTISNANMTILSGLERIKDYGNASGYPVYQQDSPVQVLAQLLAQPCVDTYH
ncbi:hypothetical protein [Shewanella sp.]|uniref:hypothetical protein n=1 Tax=Shewanella sp. TaxID=50422 RepID=UPI003A975DE0